MCSGSTVIAFFAAAHFWFAIEYLCVLFFLRSKTHLCVSHFWKQVISMFIGIKKKSLFCVLCFYFDSKTRLLKKDGSPWTHKPGNCSITKASW